MAYYAFVGGWGFRPGPKGLGIYAYDPQSGEMTHLKTVHEELSVGFQLLDRERGVLYVTDESAVRRGEAVGGAVLAFTLDGERGLAGLNSLPTPLPKPSGFCLDSSGRYALVSHHGDMGRVTKLVRRADGTFTAQTVTDDAGLALLSVEEDGRLGRVLDVVLTPGEDPFGPHALSHQHCVTADPSGALFLVCDKGMDRIYSFRLDRERGRLELLRTTRVADGFAPRLAAFHPTLPVVYGNNEHQPEILAFRYDVVTGALEEAGRCRLCEDAGEQLLGLALLMHPNGRTLYTSLRGADAIVVLDIDGEGRLHRRQTVPCGGENPRGLCLAPDGRFLLCANTGSGTVTRFAVASDGTLTWAGEPVRASSAASISISEILISKME